MPAQRRLFPLQRKELLKRVLQENVSVSQACREFGVSRPTFYKWKKRIDGIGKNVKYAEKQAALSDQRPSGQSHWNAVDPAIVRKVLDLIVSNPTLSSHRLAQKIAGVGNHGVQNILERERLSRYELRLAYSQAQKEAAGPIFARLLGKVRYVLEQFIPSLAPAPPPLRTLGSLGQRLFKPFFISSLVTFLVFSAVISWVRLLGAQTPTSALGLIFATIALTMGSIFFLYSLKYYLSLAIVLSFGQTESAENIAQSAKGKRRGILSWILGLAKNGNGPSTSSGLKSPVGLTPNLEHIVLKRHPKVSVHIPLYNEKNVVERILSAVTSFEYKGEYEVVLADDSTDETTQIILNYLKTHSSPASSSEAGRAELKTQKGKGWTLTEGEIRKGVVLKHLHRTSRSGFKGGALREALIHTDPDVEFITVFDADFVPYPDTLELFLKYFQATAGSLDFTKPRMGSPIAAVQGYQWHVLNKSENWITRGIRSEYAGSYVIERSGTEIYSGLRQISGAVYMIRRDVLEEIGWETSITEDFQLTLKLYEKGYKVVYTPYIQAPAECVSTLKRLIRQRMRWAEGHSNNIRKMFTRLIFNPNLSLSEKLEFTYLSPYYLQSFFFLVGTISWLISETLFPARLPFWTSIWGWSLILTNMLSLPLMNAVGLFLEESEQRDYTGLASFVTLSYILVPFQAYAAVKGFLQKEEGPWFRTPKTGRITDVFTRGKFYRFISGILPGRKLATAPVSAVSHQPLAISKYLSLATANSRFDSFRTFRKRPRWIGKIGIALVIIFAIMVNSLIYFVPPTQATFSPSWYALWYDSAWTYRKKLTIDNTKVSGSANLSNFPVLVAYSDTDLRTTGDGGKVENTSGFDIIFTNSTNTKLDHEIEDYTSNGTTGTIVMWVRVPTLNYNVDTELFIYYGNSSISASQEDIPGTWEINYKGVWHLNEGDSTATDFYKDSSGNTNHGTLTDADGDSVAATTPIDGSFDFNGDADFIDVGSDASLDFPTVLTAEIWFNIDADTTDILIGKRTSTGWQMFYDSGVGDELVACDDGSGGLLSESAASSISINTWYYAVCVWDEAAPLGRVYIDGVQSGTESTTGTFEDNTALDVNLGSQPDGSLPFDGTIDEVRLSNTPRSSDWIKTSYDNQVEANQGTGTGKFIKTLGSQETENDWQNRKKLTIDNTKVDGSADHSSFPVLVAYSDTALRTTGDGGKVENTSGFDIVFTDDDGITKFDHEIEDYTSTGSTGTIVIWVRFPTLPFNTDKDFYIYYGNSSISTSQENINGVWETNYKLVQHLQEAVNNDTDGYVDSTKNDNDGTGTSMALTEVAGRIGTAQDFDGSADYITIANESNFDFERTDTLTLEAWINPDDWDSQGIFSKQESSGNIRGWILFLEDAFASPREDKVGFQERSTGSNDLAMLTVKDYTGTSGWKHIVATYDGTSAAAGVTIYVDGVSETLETNSDDLSTTILQDISPQISGRGGANFLYNGKIDEVRISNVVRSSDWIKTEYDNQNNQGTGAGKFIKTLGSEEEVPELVILLLPLAIAAPIIIKYMRKKKEEKLAYNLA